MKLLKILQKIKLFLLPKSWRAEFNIIKTHVLGLGKDNEYIYI